MMQCEWDKESTTPRRESIPTELLKHRETNVAAKQPGIVRVTNPQIDVTHLVAGIRIDHLKPVAGQETHFMISLDLFDEHEFQVPITKRGRIDEENVSYLFSSFHSPYLATIVPDALAGI